MGYTPLFEKFGYRLHTNVTERLHELLVQRGAEVSTVKLLDVGTASGVVGLELHRLGYQHISGIEVVPEIALEANATGAYENIVVADIERLPMETFASASFDAVLSVATLGYLGR